MSIHRRQLPVVNPCHENWDEMDGSTRRRHCESCDQEVFDLSAMSEREAKKIVERARTRETCVRYRVGADGMVVFAPNGAPVASPIFGLKPIALGLGLLVGAAAISTTTVMGQPAVIAQPVEPTVIDVPTTVEVRHPPSTAAPPLPVVKKPPKKPEHILMGKIAPPRDED